LPCRGPPSPLIPPGSPSTTCAGRPSETQSLVVCRSCAGRALILAPHMSPRGGGRRGLPGRHILPLPCQANAGKPSCPRHALPAASRLDRGNSSIACFPQSGAGLVRMQQPRIVRRMLPCHPPTRLMQPLTRWITPVALSGPKPEPPGDSRAPIIRTLPAVHWKPSTAHSHLTRPPVRRPTRCPDPDARVAPKRPGPGQRDEDLGSTTASATNSPHLPGLASWHPTRKRRPFLDKSIWSAWHAVVPEPDSVAARPWGVPDALATISIEVIPNSRTLRSDPTLAPRGGRER
jgi:hypothetical protein